MTGVVPSKVVFHHSAGMGGFDSIRESHLVRGYAEIGYNLVVSRSGKLRYGRPIGVQPAANGRGQNKATVAICAVGNNLVAGQEWLPAQIATCQRILDGLRLVFPGIEFCGHRDVRATECPGVEISTLLR